MVQNRDKNYDYRYMKKLYWSDTEWSEVNLINHLNPVLDAEFSKGNCKFQGLDTQERFVASFKREVHRFYCFHLKMTTKLKQKQICKQRNKWKLQAKQYEPNLLSRATRRRPTLNGIDLAHIVGKSVWNTQTKIAGTYILIYSALIWMIKYKS